MGSFATNVHVRSNYTSTVADTLRRLLIAEGYEITEEEPERGFPMAPPSQLRAIRVSTSGGGWVSLLDSEGLYAQNLPAVLSGELKTHAIQFFVNDSDSWHYQLFYGGQKIDAFDSSPDEEGFEDDDEGPATVENAGAARKADEVQRFVKERTQQLEDQLLQGMPPHVREIREKMRTARQITLEELREYSAWLQTRMPSLMDQVRELRIERAKRLSSQPPTAKTARFQRHLPHLRPLLKGDVKDSRVIEILSEETTFAEETLGKFLPLIGIAPFYANLSYPYVLEYTSADLARESIQLSEHLKFKRSNSRGASILRIHR
ncbi:MAG TPA: hypothetical protein VH592_06935 [Gemmataceae bacterium]|jgi:hypothetical protein